MRKASITLALLACGALTLRAGTTPLYENLGAVSYYPAPQIDAYAFANYGTFDVISALPFDFQNTLYFTNQNEMSGNPGFFFDTASSTQARKPAVSFLNASGANITASGDPSYLIINASNIVNKGLLTVSAGGWLKVSGQDVDLNRSGLQVLPLQGGGRAYFTETNFYPDVGITDLYWGGITNMDMDVTTLLTVNTNTGTIVRTPSHEVYTIGGFGRTSFSLRNPTAAVWTNQLTSSNLLVQAAFVGLADTNLSTRIRFSGPGRGPKTVVAEISFTETNLVTDQPAIQNLYLLDQLATSTNYVLLTNLATGLTLMPANYQLTRSAPFEFLTGDGGNATVKPDLFSSMSFSNTVVSNLYAAYAAEVASQAAQVPSVPGASGTNLPGRVEINAKALDISRTRIRGNAFVRVQTDHLIDSTRALVDSPNLMYSLASTNGTLKLQNLAKEEVARFGGNLYAFSALWTNFTGELVTNEVTDPETGETTNEVTTNVIEILFHLFMLNGNILHSSEPVTVQELTMRSTNMTLIDNMILAGPLLIDGQGLTLNGRLTLSGSLTSFGASNAPSLRFFTNTGTFRIPNLANFGNDRADPYAAFINRGQLQASACSVRSDYFQNSGRIQSSGPLMVQAGIGKLDTGSSDVGSDAHFTFQELKLHRYTNSTQGTLYLNVANSLADSGPTAANVVTVSDGFHLYHKPPLGDLFGTRLQTTAPRLSSVDHTWAAEDRGATPAGFANNVAVGRLVLSAGPDGLLRLHSPSPQGRYGLYADFLQLDGIVLTEYLNGSLEEALQLDPNLVIYFAYANVDVEQLDGALGGRLRWVRDFAGPNSSVKVALPSGQSLIVNRGLRESMTIDSDGDGNYNGNDDTPFAEPALQAQLVEQPTLRTLISWPAAPLTVYQVEYTTDLAAPEWVVLTTASNPAAATRLLFVEDAVGEGQPQRYYRVRYQP